ncbi:MAG: hypothetical protein AVDCRST_MAG90-968 [uncultured Microvirga sp.]|uniref:Death on curing protein, Doc toxin n=1 Tax=uncultured Microvirga sp. TaxID=412392 RepID=A0A6J4L5X7_9HYPH|nr:MAG: hypothetical protein AVDCRST_MAG90-968 [uncultured Microvirga sp.]
MRVRYRLGARLDIANIHRYLSERNPRAATNVIGRIRAAADQLGRHPRMGRAGRTAGTYEWVVTGLPYIVVYDIDEIENEVAILAVFHGAQDR